jgi:hypothetical protein
MTFTRAGQSDFLRIALKLHQAQRDATTPESRLRADTDLAQFFQMSAAGKLNYWLATHDVEVDDSMSANPED